MTGNLHPPEGLHSGASVQFMTLAKLLLNNATNPKPCGAS
jgi:hypothetical protein